MAELPSYLQKAYDPDDFKNWAAILRQAIIDHPEDELILTQQLAIRISVNDNYDETIALCERLMMLDTEKLYSVDAYLILARVWTEKKDTTKAISFYRKAIEAEPECGDAINELGRIYFKMPNYDEAIKVYELLDNDDIYYGKEDKYRLQATCYYNKREFDTALDCYQKALELDTEDMDGWLTESIAETYWQMKNYKESMQWFRNALVKNPSSANAHYGMGLCYMDTNESYLALHHYFEAIKSKPDFPEVYNNIAFIEINFEGDYKKGVEFLEKAIETDPNSKIAPTIYLNLKRVYQSMGEFQRADYYKAKFIKSMGFDVGYEEEDDDDDGDVLK